MMAFRRTTGWSLMLAAVIATSERGRCGTVITDGSLGPARTLTGPNYSIPASLGQLRGGNLFQSFRSLNLSDGDVATFTGPSTVANVLARVTGGQSNIDGTLACSIPHAAFYLINSSGVIFGPSAALDVRGSFTVTTADEVKLTDGHAYTSARTTEATLTSAAPKAFGFLSPHPAAITCSGSLSVSTGRSLSIAGGPVSLNGGTLTAPGGLLDVVAVNSKGELSRDPATGLLNASVPFTALGDVAITNNGLMDTSSAVGGAIDINARSMQLNDSTITSNTSARGVGQPVDINLTGTLSTRDGVILISTQGAGTGGNIAINAKDIRLSGSTAQGGIFVLSLSTATGNAGHLSLHTHKLQILNGEVTSFALGRGNGGNVTVQADDLGIDGAVSPTQFTGVRAETEAAGNAGNITVKADTLHVTDSGEISTDTLGVGRAGNLSIAASNMVVDGPSTGAITEISASSESGASGAAGNIDILAKTLRVAGSGAIGVDTFGSGNGGNLTIDVPDIVVDGTEAPTIGAIVSAQSASGSSGNAGSLAINATHIDVLGGAVIEATTGGSGKAGDLNINAGEINVDGSATPGEPTGIAVESEPNSTGNAGTLTLNTGTLQVLGGAQLTAVTFGSGRGGDVSIKAAQVVVDGTAAPTLLTGIIAESAPNTGPAGTVNIYSRGPINVTFGQINTSSSQGGNSLNLASRSSITITDHSTVSASAQSTGGDLSIAATSVVNIGGDSSVTTNGGNVGNGGNLSIDSLRLSLDPRHLSRISANGGIDGGNLSLSADQRTNLQFRGIGTDVTARGLSGVNGSIASTPDQNDVASIATLVVPTFNLAIGLIPNCGMRLNSDQSSFTLEGGNGLPADPGNMLPSDPEPTTRPASQIGRRDLCPESNARKE